MKEVCDIILDAKQKAGEFLFLREKERKKYITLEREKNKAIDNTKILWENGEKLFQHPKFTEYYCNENGDIFSFQRKEIRKMFMRKKAGYKEITMSCNSKKYNVKVHRFILEAKMGRLLQEKEFCLHINPDQDDTSFNSFCNLKPGTRKENEEEKKIFGSIRLEKNPFTNFSSVEEIIFVRLMAHEGYSIGDIAVEYIKNYKKDLKHLAAYRAITGINFKDLNDFLPPKEMKCVCYEDSLFYQDAVKENVENFLLVKENDRFYHPVYSQYYCDKEGNIYSVFKNRKLKQRENNKGYLLFGVRQTWKASHRFILECKLGREIREGCESSHLNDILNDNRIENLVEETKQENIKRRKYER